MIASNKHIETTLIVYSKFAKAATSNVEHTENLAISTNCFHPFIIIFENVLNFKKLNEFEQNKPKYSDDIKVYWLIENREPSGS